MFKNNSVNDVFLLPKKSLKYVNNAKKSEMKVLLYLFANMDSFDVEKAAEQLNETKDSVMSALSYWRGTGIISETDDEDKNDNRFPEEKNEEEKRAVSNGNETEQAVKREEKGYSTLEIADARKNDADFSYLVDYTEKVTGELMNSAKQGDLLYLYDSLGMACDVIMGIVAHCVSEDKKKIRYIVKTAEGIHNDGVRTGKELESYLTAKKNYKDFSTFVKKLIGAGDRTFTPAEEKAVKKWESELHVSRELVEYAYERNVSLISRPSIPYMSKILEGWCSEGIDTLEKAREQAEKQRNKAKNEQKDSGISEKAKKAGFDIDLEDIFEKP